MVYRAKARNGLVLERNMLDPGVKRQRAKTECLMGEESSFRNTLGFGEASPTTILGTHFTKRIQN